MDELHFVSSQLERLRLLGERYRESVAEAAAAKDYFEENRTGFDNARLLAVRHLKTNRQWGEFCWEYPLALKGADEFWMTPAEREGWWQQARDAAEFWSDAKGLGHSLGALANLNSDMNRLSEAHQLYEERLELAEREQQTLAIVKTLLNLGNSHLRQGELDKARQRLHEARRAAQTHDIPREEARALGNLAVTTYRLGRTMMAVRMLRTRLLVLNRCEDPTQRASTHGNLGRYLTALQRFEEAEDHLRRSLEMHVAARNFVREAFALTAISDLHESKGDIETAVLIMEKARDIFKDESQQQLASDCEEEIERMSRLSGSN